MKRIFFVIFIAVMIVLLTVPVSAQQRDNNRPASTDQGRAVRTDGNPTVSAAPPAACQLTIARLRYGGGGDWYTGPSMLPNLVNGVRERTKLPVCDTATVVQISDQRLFHFPFLFMTGHGEVRFTAQERLRLRKFLVGGGFFMGG